MLLRCRWGKLPCIKLFLVSGHCFAGAIPYRQEHEANPWQPGLGYGLTLFLLAALVLALFLLRRRLGSRLAALVPARQALQCVASLHLPARTIVHVVRWQGRDVMFAQCGESVSLLAVFDMASTSPSPADHRP